QRPTRSGFASRIRFWCGRTRSDRESVRGELGGVTAIGLNLAKHIFQVHGVDGDGATVPHKQLRRGRGAVMWSQVDDTTPRRVGDGVGASNRIELIQKRGNVELGSERKCRADERSPYLTPPRPAAPEPPVRGASAGHPCPPMSKRWRRT